MSDNNNDEREFFSKSILITVFVSVLAVCITLYVYSTLELWNDTAKFMGILMTVFTGMLTACTALYVLFTLKLFRETVRSNETSRKIFALTRLYEKHKENSKYSENIDNLILHVLSDDIKDMEEQLINGIEPTSEKIILEGITPEIEELVKSGELQKAEEMAKNQLKANKSLPNVRNFVYVLLNYKDREKTIEACQYLLKDNIGEISLYRECAYQLFESENIELAIKISERGIEKNDDSEENKSLVYMNLAYFYATRMNKADEEKAREYANTN